MASGGTRPAGSGCAFKEKTKGQQMNHLLPSYLEAWLNFVSSLKGLPIGSPLFSH